ncbi:MAG: hypothetical protein J7L83_01620 [Thaumarchaeota archaeon]|nr:hypothetical protein [Nitrososphaerota archaeon]
MSDKVDREIFDEIERDVQRILRERKSRGEKRGGGAFTVHYFKLKKPELSEKVLDRVRQREMVLMALECPNLNEIEGKTLEMAQKIREEGGKAYFIKYPVMLVMPEGAKLEIYG